MDLTHDWKALNEVLFQAQGISSGASSLVLVEDASCVVDGVTSNGKAFSDLGVEGVSQNKDKLDALASKYSVDQGIVVSKTLLDQAVAEAASLGPNYFQQLQSLRSAVLGQSIRRRPFAGSSGAGLVVSRKNFLLDLFSRHLRRALPRRFNVLLFVDQRPSAFSGNAPAATPISYRALLLSYSNGQLDQFFEPDFSSLHGNRLANWAQESKAIGQYLESRYILPCYGVFLHRDEWQRCLEAASQKRHPWRLFVQYFDDQRAAVYPLNTLARVLLAFQRVFAYFGRS